MFSAVKKTFKTFKNDENVVIEFMKILKHLVVTFPENNVFGCLNCLGKEEESNFADIYIMFNFTAESVQWIGLEKK